MANASVMPMDYLAHKHLVTLTLDVDFKSMLVIGSTPSGHRRIAPVTGGQFSGGRLNGTVLPGADWVINRSDGVMVIDVRLALKTDDSALIYLSYEGRFLASADAMLRFSKGELLKPDEYSLVIVAKFECGADRYAWLNNVVAVGTGQQMPHGPVYSLFEIG